jgi:hypothetical protein
VRELQAWGSDVVNALELFIFVWWHVWLKLACSRCDSPRCVVGFSTR